MTHADIAAAAVARNAQAAADRIRRSDLLIAAAVVDVHGAAHLKPVADRLAGLAASLPSDRPDSTPEPTQGAESAAEAQEAPRE